MAIPLSAQIVDAVRRTKDSYYKLVLVVGPPRTGKTTALSELAAQNNWARINVSLNLAEVLLNLTQHERAVRAAGILDDLVETAASEVVLLDNIELLFAAELKLDPLRLIQSLSRNRALIVAWPGHFDGVSLTYAEPGHPEERCYRTPQVSIVTSNLDYADAASTIMEEH